MRQPFRLTRSNEIKRVRRNGKSFPHPLFVMIRFPNQLGFSRFTISASKRVGNAVIRNRSRRRIRACVRQFYPSMAPGWDILFLARQPIQMATYAELRSAIDSQLRRAGILGEINVD
ncbi:MAG: ribonuclease P protein component [Anaerolineaceae bacterium]|nr:ribonuclease P protein component [Anaerolineaceae bacterium]